MAQTDVDPFISSWVDHIFQSMQDDVRTGKDVEPELTFLGNHNGGNALIPVLGMAPLFASKDGKAKVRATVKKIWSNFSGAQPQLTLLAVVMGSDAWYERPSLEEAEKIEKHGRVGPFPHKDEALIVQVSLADVEIQYIVPYKREGNEVVFLDRVATFTEDPGNSLLMGLWPL
jgi:hypothetical protein